MELRSSSSCSSSFSEVPTFSYIIYNYIYINKLYIYIIGNGICIFLIGTTGTTGTFLASSMMHFVDFQPYPYTKSPITGSTDNVLRHFGHIDHGCRTFFRYYLSSKALSSLRLSLLAYLLLSASESFLPFSSFRVIPLVIRS